MSPVGLTDCVSVSVSWVQTCRQEGVKTGLSVYRDVSW